MSEEASEHEDARSGAAPTSIRVLMVDDAPASCRMIGIVLARAGGFDFHHCQHGDEALRLVKELEPDLVLQDLGMPDVDGLELIRRYRSDPATASVPILVLSGDADPARKAAAFQLGADDYLAKSVERVELVARIRHQATRYQAMKREGLHRLATGHRAHRHTVRALVLEPSAVVQTMIASALRKEPDMAFRLERTEGAALRAAEEFLPTIVVVNMLGGGYDGLELIERIRATEATRDVPIVVYTSQDDPALKARALDAGANDYVVKSADLTNLVARMRVGSGHYFDARQARLAAAAHDATDDGRERVLVLDEDAARRASIAAALAGESTFDVRADGESSLSEALRTFAPALVILGLEASTPEGLGTLRALRDNPLGRDVPAIVVGRGVDAALKPAAFAGGANDWLEQGAPDVELVFRAHQHARAYRTAQQLKRTIESALQMQKRLEVQRDFIRRTFGRYLSNDVVDALLERPDGLALGGQAREVTLMMTDLRGFTSMSEHLAPDQVLALLNHYLDAMTTVLARHGATIDEFIGDAILALFGAPEDMPDHAARAVACAIEMQNAMEAVNAHNTAQGYPELEMGIGLHTGEVVVGNIGSERRAKYGVVGKHVNLTSRVESFTTGGQILASEATLARAGERVVTRGSRVVHPKGSKAPITIFDVTGVGAPYDARLVLPDPSVHTLKSPLWVVISEIAEKAKRPETRRARMLALGPRDAIVELEPAARDDAHAPTLPLDGNVVCTVLDDEAPLPGELYARVIEAPPDANTRRLRFTSIAPVLRALLDAARALAMR